MRHTLARLLTAALAGLALSGCKTKYVAVPEYHFVDSTKMVYLHDSVFTHDSVFVSQYVKGDTVYRDKVKTTCLYKDRLRVDTVAVVKRDSVPCVVEKKVTEYKYRTRWYDKACRVITLVALLAGGLWLFVWRVRKR